MTKKENNTALAKKLAYWRDYDGVGDAYRRTHDLDCILTGGNLNADTIISLWLPLRYTLNYFNKPKWQFWRDTEYASKGRLKDNADFLNDLIDHMDDFLPPESEVTQKLSTLFNLAEERANIMLLPQGKRSWNSRRGFAPYWDYLPHFLFDLFAYSTNEDVLRCWLEEESLEPFFENGIFAQERILDLAGTGSVCRHAPRDIKIEYLLDNYIAILRQRKQLLAARAS